jgi:hypothetical protein
MQKNHSAQRYVLVQELAWFNVWRRYGKVFPPRYAQLPLHASQCSLIHAHSKACIQEPTSDQLDTVQHTGLQHILAIIYHFSVTKASLGRNLSEHGCS